MEENKGISENTNECLKFATGDYIGLLDHDDILHESALYEMMKVIEEEKADFLYSDEVKFSGKIEDASDLTSNLDLEKMNLELIIIFVILQYSKITFRSDRTGIQTGI